MHRPVALALLLSALAPPSNAQGKGECDRPRCALTPMIARCNSRGNFSSVERGPCRFVCTSPCRDQYCVKPGRVLYTRRLSEAICDDLP